MPDGSLIPFFADRLTDEIRNNCIFYCKCGLQITANIPKIKGRNPYYSSKANSCHSADCPYYHNHILEEVIHRIDPIGKNIHSLEDLLAGITSGGSVPELRAERVTPPADPADQAPPPEDKRLVVKKKDKPSSLIDLYELLNNPDINTYAGRDPKELIIDRKSIPIFKTEASIKGIKVAVAKRCKQSDIMEARLQEEGLFKRSIVLRAPKDYPRFMEGIYSHLANRQIYYVLLFRDYDQKSKAFEKIINPRNGLDPTFLAIADWEKRVLVDYPYSILLIGNISRQAQLVHLPPDRNHEQ